MKIHADKRWHWNEQMDGCLDCHKENRWWRTYSATCNQHFKFWLHSV